MSSGCVFSLDSWQIYKWTLKITKNRIPLKGTLSFLMKDYFARQTPSFKCTFFFFLSLDLNIEFPVSWSLLLPTVLWKDPGLSLPSPDHIFQGRHKALPEACFVFPHSSLQVFKSVGKEGWTGYFPMCENFSSWAEIKTRMSQPLPTSRISQWLRGWSV